MAGIPLVGEAGTCGTVGLPIGNSFDPRGAKVGGLETFIRDMLAFAPEDFSFLMIGVDAIGNLELGKVSRQTFRGKTYDFLPVLQLRRAQTVAFIRRKPESLVPDNRAARTDTELVANQLGWLVTVLFGPGTQSAEIVPVGFKGRTVKLIGAALAHQRYGSRA